MIEQLRKRLAELKEEYKKGENRQQELEADLEQLKGTMLRIKNAMDILKEELERALSKNQNSNTTD